MVWLSTVAMIRSTKETMIASTPALAFGMGGHCIVSQSGAQKDADGRSPRT
jgi:hypothetical protein